MRRPSAPLLTSLTSLLLAGCIGTTTPSPIASPSAEPIASASPSATDAASPSPEPTSTTTPEPEAANSLDLPDETDARVVRVNVEPDIGAQDGTLLVTVRSNADDMIEELVLRWPRGLGRALLLRPFQPSEQRIAENGPPLVQEWTKWVLGPGEEGEPAGTVSLGWGPLRPGATLRIPVDVVRRANGPVAFDLQVLTDNAILTLPGGEPAELRVEVP
jgi:hypothetical protein